MNETNPAHGQVVSIDMEGSQLNNTNPFTADDTFTQLASRTPVDKTTNRKLYVIPPNNHQTMTTTLDDSGEFAVPTSANSEDIQKSFNFPPTTGEFLPGIIKGLDNQPLPTPVEVISIKDEDFSQTDMKKDGIKENLNISGDPSLNPFLNESLKDSKDEVALLISNEEEVKSATQSFGNLNGIKEDEREGRYPLIPAKSEPHMLSKSISKGHQPCKQKKDEVVNMDLVDSSFTPYKKKSVSNGDILQKNGDIAEEESLPKMKIFLPKTNDDDSDEGGSSLSSEDDDQQTTNVKNLNNF